MLAIFTVKPVLSDRYFSGMETNVNAKMKPPHDFNKYNFQP